MKRTAILAAAAITLASCTTTRSIDTAIRSSLPKTCSLIETAHAAFVAASASGDIKASTARKEAAARADRLVDKIVNAVDERLLAFNLHVVVIDVLTRGRNRKRHSDLHSVEAKTRI